MKKLISFVSVLCIRAVLLCGCGKKKDKNILFGISPEGNIDNNYTSNYIDTKKFAGNSGYVDYLMPQIYFGFFNSIKPNNSE